MQRILVIDDEKDILDLVASALKYADFDVDKAENGELAYAFVVEENDYDLIVCDVMMPKMGGFTFAEKIREIGILTPILFLTAKDSLDNKLRGFDSGADDYMTKPFSVEELIARVKAILKRTAVSSVINNDASESQITEIAGIRIDHNRKAVFCGEKDCELTPTEYHLLEFLFENRGRVVSKDDILFRLWGDSDYIDRPDDGYALIEAYISFIRRKIDTDPKKSIIKTKRKMGYIVDEK